MTFRKILFFLVFIFSISVGYSQMTATFNKTINTLCNGSGCNYTGPTILINEIQIAPAGTYDGSLSGDAGTNTGRGEWIELYNPDQCNPIDISCYYLGNAATGSNATTIYGGGFQLPQGTVVPPAGFCLVRGINAAPVPAANLVSNGGNVVEVVVPGAITGTGLCTADPGYLFNTPRLWFPNAGGWFAFYDNNGVPQDAVSWGTISGSATQPCVPQNTGCNTGVTSLASYDNIPANRKNFIYTGSVATNDNTIRRMPDGASWVVDQKTTIGTPGACNDASNCAISSASSCDGTATVNVTGGTAPYTYQWNDSQSQMTQTATGLCEGAYQVIVTDNTGTSQTFSVTIQNYVPTVSFSAQTAVCNEGQTVSLTGFSPTATTGQQGVFTGTGVTGSSFNVATAGNGTFPLTYQFTDENGCENTATSSITVNPKPVASISGINPTYCLSNNTITPTLSPAGGTLSGPGVSGNTISIFNAGPGTHTIKYIVTNQYGCSDTAQVSFTVTSTTPPVFTVQDEICIEAAPISLSGTPAGGVFTVGSQTITQFDPAQFGLGQHIISYTVTDSGGQGCLSQTSDTITVINGGTITTNTPTHFCFGSPDYTVVIQPTGGVLAGTLVNGNTLEIANATTGNYSFTYNVTSSQGCASSYTHNFTIGNPLTVEYKTSIDCFQGITFNATPANYSNYSWTENGSIIGSGNPLFYTAEIAGDHTYTLTATDANGCKAIYTDLVDVPDGVNAEDFNIPNVLTPNNDGVNDYIEMPLMNLDCIEYKVLIVNRWGHLVYEASKTNPTFNGKDKKGVDLNEGVYFYKIVSDDFNCKEEPYKSKCHGFITIKK
ncbi:MAG: gliding motility-associated C-terminal domain-containing protein [Crocinitomicaceae bacterium]|nr:gliding motility-associated C-terminal domain-containing protein [Crocinitomicaceae bacterium]